MVNSESIDCKHADEFFYTTPQNHCASYYRCHSNQISKFDCPFGTMFDFYKQSCVSSTSKFLFVSENLHLIKNIKNLIAFSEVTILNNLLTLNFKLQSNILLVGYIFFFQIHFYCYKKCFTILWDSILT